MKIHTNAAIVVLVILFSACSIAEVRFNGFASVRAGVTSGDDESLYGYDGDIDFKPESLFALQASSDLGDGLTATAQIIARGADDFDAEMEWAYLTYAVNDEFEISAGRLRVPFFKYSEFIDVGYAYPWARPPQDVYDISFNTMEGIRFNYNTSVGFWDLSWQLVYGGFEENLDISGNQVPTETTDLVGLALDATYDWFSFRLGYTIGTATFDIDLSALQSLFPNSSDFDDLAAEEDDAYFGSAGVFIDYSDWLLNLEVIQFEAEDNLVNQTDAFYVMLGKRLGSFTLSYTYSELEESNDFDVVNGIPESIPNPDPTTTSVCGETARDFVANCVIVLENENSTHNIALRWDFHPAAALTLDYTDREFDIRNSLSSSESDSLISAGVDVVF